MGGLHGCTKSETPSSPEATPVVTESQPTFQHEDTNLGKPKTRNSGAGR